MSATMSPVIGEATVQELREAVRGEVLAPGDEGYEQACHVWNRMFDNRRPALVVRCLGAADVIAAVGFARSNNLPLAVRGGAHSIAGFSTTDDGLVIDLSLMRSVRVDQEKGLAYVGGGAVWADVDHETQAYGLATTGGFISSTGVGGFTLGGGIGWLMRKHGLTCDNLIGADVVTADGRLVRASEETNPELLWALRGGGGNFGIVTQFDLKVHPVGPIVHAGPIFFPAELALPLLRLFREWAPEAPDDVTAFVNLTTAPPLPVIPEAWHGQKVAALIALSVGSFDEADERLKPFRALGEPVADLLGPMPYTTMQSLVDPFWAHPIRSYFKSTNLARLDDSVLERWAELHLAAPGPQAEVHVQQMGGAVGRVPEDGSAFVDRSMPFLVNVVTGWHDPPLDQAHIAWARDAVAAAGPVDTGHAYVNFQGDALAGEALYGAEKYARLVTLKREYDPTNVFRLNQNIAP